MNSDELARWLRDKGIHESDIQKFKGELVVVVKA